MRNSTLLNSLAAFMVVSPVLCAPSLGADAVQYDLKIEQQPLRTALQEFAKQSGVQIIFFSQVTDGHQASSLNGKYTAADALQLLLDHSELTFREINETTIGVQPKAAATGAKKTAGVSFVSPASMTNSGERIRLAQATAVEDAAATTSTPASSTAAREAMKNTIQEVIVTATKREESIQKVPASVTAFSQETLERIG